MKVFLRWALRLVLLMALMILVMAYWQRERLTRLMAVTSLFAEDKIVANFISMEAMFEHAPLGSESAFVNRLPAGAPMDMPVDFESWAEARAVTGIIVLKDGQIRYESYPLLAVGEGDPAVSLRIGWSVSKSFLSVLTGILHEEGAIPDLDAQVEDIVPELVGSAYEGATIRNVLQMSSGVRFNEDYLDFWSDINRMGRVLALGGSMDGFAAGLSEREARPGDAWKYVSIDTHVLGMVIRGATGRSVIDLMAEKIIEPLGMTRTPYYVTDGEGVAFALGGLNLTTHDYALFGYMVSNGGIAFGHRFVSEAWITESTAASARTQPGEIGYGYQWWVPVGAGSGEFMGRGVYGQYLYIDRSLGVVIAVNAADRGFREEGVSDRNVEMLRAIAMIASTP